MPAGESPLLQTKLELPPPCADDLPRERLLALAPTATGTRLLLLSAPAGYGKTTFLATWCRAQAEQRGAAVAWLALDERDNDRSGFLAYLVAAVGRAIALPDELSDVAPTPADAAGASAEIVLTRLINVLAALDRDCLLVLDDYQVIDVPAIHAAITFLLDHLPQRVCLAIGSRADPPLPLTRLRARGQLVELRAADLRFTADEIPLFFQLAGDVAVTPDETRAIESYLEGWPAGARLLIGALRAAERERAVGDAPDERRVHNLFAHLDDNRHELFAYLADEVFERQPVHLKTFLLQTAILDRMCGPLCDAVLGLIDDPQRATVGAKAQPPGSPRPSPVDSYTGRILEQLEWANVFVVPLDDERRWYRYHALFCAFLRARLAHEPPGLVAELHRRASAWFEQNHALPDAVEHALAAGEAGRAAELLEPLAAALIEQGECAALYRWLEAIPAELLESSPALCLWAARAALLAGEMARIEPSLQRAEQTWQAQGNRRKLSEVAHLRAHLARRRHDASRTSGEYGAQHAALVEPLSERELEVLRLIGSGAGNQTIADTLVVSIGTVKSHVNHILGKLAACNRTEAVARARALGLLTI